MGAYKDKGGRWYVSVRYKNWLGEGCRKTKRGFSTKRDALEWEREFLARNTGSLDMTFGSFYEVYKNNLQDRIRQNTWVTKSSIIEKKILPYFGSKWMCDIKPIDVLHWQNEMLAVRDENGMPYSPVYLKTIHNQLSAIFNHAVRFYGLHDNPAAITGNMGKEKAGEVLIWTKEEYLQFVAALKDRPVSYMAFETLYWCGLRLGDADGKISLNQQKPSKHAGLRRFGPEKFLQRNNEFMKERPIFYKKPIKTEKDFSTWLRCFYYTTKAVITEYIYF